MPKHKDLTGEDLHPSRVLLDSPDRAPDYPGEIVFDGVQTWIANGSTQNDWKLSASAPPKVFSWVLTRFGYVPSGNSLIKKIELYFMAISRLDVNSNLENFSHLNSWEVGTDISATSPIALTDWVQKKGLGCYVVLISGPDAYGNTLSPIENARLFLPDEGSSPALTIFQTEGEFLAVDGAYHTRPYGFEISQAFAQIELQLGNQQ